MPAAAELPHPAARAGRRSAALWAGLAGFAALGLALVLARARPEPLPVLWTVPSFELVASDGRSFGTAELAGRVWVASFFFTRCRSICPRLVEHVRALAERADVAGLDLALVSLSVDPEHDTPERLAEYARERRIADPDWVLLTGEGAAVRGLVENGFKVPVGPAEALGPGLIDIAHTGSLVLVDARGDVRGVYDPNEGLEHILRDAGTLVARGGA